MYHAGMLTSILGLFSSALVVYLELVIYCFIFNLYKKLKGIDRVSIGYRKGIDTLKDKDKDKYKDKYISSLVLSSLLNLYHY